MPAIEARLTMALPCSLAFAASRNAGAANLVPRNTPVMFTATSLFHSSRLMSSIPLPMKTPALLTRMSSLPNLLTARLTAAVQSSSLGHVQVRVLGLPTGGGHGSDGLASSLIEHVGDHDLGAFLRHQPGGFSADTARGTGDQGNLAIETIHGVIRFPVMMDLSVQQRASLRRYRCLGKQPQGQGNRVNRQQSRKASTRSSPRRWQSHRGPPKRFVALRAKRHLFLSGSPWLESPRPP